MDKEKVKTGKSFERCVADAYRAMGAHKVEHDIELAGHQIDIYVELGTTVDHSHHRIAVEARDRKKVIGIGQVRDYSEVVDSLRRLDLIDEGVIVGAHGFSRPGRTRARKEGIRLFELADLEARAREPDLSEMRIEYLRSVHRRFEYLDLGGIAPRVQNRTVKLRMEDVFIPLQARPKIDTHPDWPSGTEAISETASRTRPVEIPTLLRHPHVVVIGDPGSGKSTLLRHVAYSLADDDENVSEAVLERLPIYVRILQFSQARIKDPALTLDTYIRQKSQPRWAPLFQRVLEAGEALVLLDGLDEVADAHQRTVVAEAIRTLVADYAGNAFVVTSRIVGYQAARLSGDFEHYTLEPLRHEHIEAFVRSWYEAIAHESEGTNLHDEVRDRARMLSRVIRDRPGIKRLAENPLLLTIIALMNWRGRELPSRRVELYAYAAETLIESWPLWRQGVRLATDRTIRLLSPVAYRIFSGHSGSDINEDDLLPILSDTLCQVDGVKEQDAKEYSREFLSQINEHSGIFRERGFDERGRRIFSFLHLTFTEYFTARYLAGLWEGLDGAEARRVFLRKYAHIPRWREVVLLMAGDIGLRDNDRAERATRLLSDILQLKSPYEDRLHRDLLLAGDCLADNVRVQTDAEFYVLAKIMTQVLHPGVGRAAQLCFRSMRGADTMYTSPIGFLLNLLEEHPSSRWIVEALGVIGDARAVEPLMARLEDEDPLMRKAVAKALGHIGDARAVDAIVVHLDDSEKQVFWDAAVALGDIGDVRAIPPLLAALDHEQWNFRRRVMQALAEIGDAGVVEMLVERLEGDDNFRREVAAEALTFFNDARALKPLVACLEDKDGDVRRHAAEALGWIGDARAVEALAVSLEDEGFQMPSNAAEALGRIGGHQATEILLKFLLDRKQDNLTRSYVAEALGRIGGPRAIKALAECVEDEHRGVRREGALGLARNGDLSGIEVLVEWLNDDDDVIWLEVRKIIETLGSSLGTWAFDVLMARLVDEKSVIRSTAVKGLGILGDARSVDALVAYMNEADDFERWSIAEALGKIGDMRAVEVLLGYLDDRGILVARFVYEALVAILNINIPPPEVDTDTNDFQTVTGPWNK